MNRMFITWLAPLASRYGAIAIQFLTVAFVAQRMPIDAAGRYLMIMGVAQTVCLLTGVGIPDGFIPEAARMTSATQSKSVLSLGRIILVILLTATILGILMFWPILFVWKDILLATGTAIWTMAYGLLFGIAQVLVGLGYSSVGTFLFYSSSNLAGIVLVWPYLLLVPDRTLPALVLASAFAALLSAFAALALLLQHTRSPRSARPRQTVSVSNCRRVGTPIALVRFAQAIVIWLPVWAATLLLGPAEGALVGVASRLAGGAGAGLGAIRFSIRPKLARFAVQNDWRGLQRVSSQVASLASLAAILGLCLVAAVGSWLLDLLFGYPYAMAQWPLTIMLAGLLIESFGGPIDEVLKMSGDGLYVLQAQLATIIISIPLYLGLSTLGSEGLALGYSISIAALYGALVFRVYAKRGLFFSPWAWFSGPRQLERSPLR